MKYKNKDLEKAKLYEIIDAGIDPRENIIFQMLFSKKGNEDLLQDFLEKLLKKKIKKLEYNEFDMWLAFLDAKRNKEGVKRAVEENEK